MLDRALLYDFELARQRVRLWKRVGESYEHVLMKALGYAMFVREHPRLQIEQSVGLRYKPDLVERDARTGRFSFWGECGTTSVRKIGWLLKHAGVERLVLFKIEPRVQAFTEEIRAQVARKYLRERVSVINFDTAIVEGTLARKIDCVPAPLYETIVV